MDFMLDRLTLSKGGQNIVLYHIDIVSGSIPIYALIQRESYIQNENGIFLVFLGLCLLNKNKIVTSSINWLIDFNIYSY